MLGHIEESVFRGGVTAWIDYDIRFFDLMVLMWSFNISHSFSLTIKDLLLIFFNLNHLFFISCNPIDNIGLILLELANGGAELEFFGLWTVDLYALDEGLT